MTRTLCLPFYLLLFLSLPARADETSGPPVGDKVPALKVYAVTGEPKDKEVDYRDLRKDKPTVYVFINEWSRPVARFLRTLDKACKDDAPEAYLVAVWLTDEVDKTKEYLPKAQQSLQLDNTALTVFPGAKASGPDGWGVNSITHVTVVVANKGKVAATFGLVSTDETDVPKVRAALKKAVGKK